MLAELFAQAADEAKENLSSMNEGAIEKENAHRGARYSVKNARKPHYSKHRTKFSDALTSMEWEKYNHSMTTGMDAGLRVSDNSVLVECEEGNIYDYKYIIYDNSFEDNPIKNYLRNRKY